MADTCALRAYVHEDVWVQVPLPVPLFWRDGRVWLIALVLKTNNGASRSGVQIPISSPMGQ